MNLTRWSALDELIWLWESLGLSAGDLPDGPLRALRRTACWVPEVEVFEASREIVVRARMPGIDPQTLRVEVTAERAALQGEAPIEFDHHRRHYHRRELHYGMFKRVVALPAAVDPTTARASYRDGVLEIRVTKARRASLHVARVEIS